MSPVTHLLASWLFATQVTNDAREQRWISLAGLAPDLDGLGMVVDFAQQALGKSDSFYWYQKYHHTTLHGLAGAVLMSLWVARISRSRRRGFLFGFCAYHLHLLCDFAGSRGPDPQDVWAIYYFGPFSRSPRWAWSGQWPLDGWQDQLITLALFVICLGVTYRTGRSFVAVFNRRLDGIFTRVITEVIDRVRLVLR